MFKTGRGGQMALIHTTPHPGATLKHLMAQGGIVMAPGAPDSLTARLVQGAGFPAVFPPSHAAPSGTPKSKARF